MIHPEIEIWREANISVTAVAVAYKVAKNEIESHLENSFMQTDILTMDENTRWQYTWENQAKVLSQGKLTTFIQSRVPEYMWHYYVYFAYIYATKVQFRMNQLALGAPNSVNIWECFAYFFFSFGTQSFCCNLEKVSAAAVATVALDLHTQSEKTYRMLEHHSVAFGTLFDLTKKIASSSFCIKCNLSLSI